MRNLNWAAAVSHAIAAGVCYLVMDAWLNLPVAWGGVFASLYVLSGLQERS